MNECLCYLFKSIYLSDIPLVQFVERKYQIPVFAPYDIVVLYLELGEVFRFKISFILMMRMFADKSSNIYGLLYSIVKGKQNTKVAHIFSINNLEIGWQRFYAYFMSDSDIYQLAI